MGDAPVFLDREEMAPDDSAACRARYAVDPRPDLAEAAACCSTPGERERAKGRTRAAARAVGPSSGALWMKSAPAPPTEPGDGGGRAPGLRTDALQLHAESLTGAPSTSTPVGGAARGRYPDRETRLRPYWGSDKASGPR